MIDLGLMRETLRDCLGSVLAEDSSFFEGSVRILCSYVPGKDSFRDVSHRMEDYLFNALYDRLGPGMMLKQDDGVFRRIRLADLPMLADQAIYPLFACLKPWSVDYERVHSWWMESGSFSAMKALYFRFQDFLPSQERQLIERTVRENLPADKQAFWFQNHMD